MRVRQALTRLPCCRAEWFFRSSLDRYVWIHGMICGFMKPWAEGILVRIDNMAFRARTACRGLLLAGQFPRTWLPQCMELQVTYCHHKRPVWDIDNMSFWAALAASFYKLAVLAGWFLRTSTFCPRGTCRHLVSSLK